MFLVPKSQYAVRKTRRKGRGVFAVADIEPGTIIGDYLGKIIRPKEEENRTPHGLYAMWYNDRATIIPNPHRPGIHLINHSCAPNCGIYPYQGHKLYFALRRIFKGEEITVCYLVEIDKTCDSCAQDECKCDTPICKGTIHSPKEVIKRWEKFMASRLRPYADALPVRYGEDLPLLKKYPASIKDYPVYDLFGSFQKAPVALKGNNLSSIFSLRKSIRETGKRLSFPHLGVTIYGISGNLIIAQKS